MAQMIVAQHSIDELTEKQLRLRTPLYHPDFPFIIFWSPKAASTTIVRWFFLQLGLLNDEMKRNVQVHVFENSFKSRANYRDELLRDLKEGKKPAIKFVRDPYARAYSTYLDLCSRSAKVQKYWGEKTRRHLFSDLTGAEIASEYTFSFLQYMRWLVRQDMKTMNGHIRPQYLVRDSFISMRICKVEELLGQLKLLEREFSLPYSAENEDELINSPHYHHKSLAIGEQAKLALLQFGIPMMKSADFPFVKFDAALARNTIYERLVRRCFPYDVKLYNY